MSKAVLIAAFERAVGVFAATVLAFLGVAERGIADAPWADALSAGAYAVVLSLLASVAKSGVGPTGPGLTETTDGARR